MTRKAAASQPPSLRVRIRESRHIASVSSSLSSGVLMEADSAGRGLAPPTGRREEPLHDGRVGLHKADAPSSPRLEPDRYGDDHLVRTPFHLEGVPCGGTVFPAV